MTEAEPRARRPFPWTSTLAAVSMLSTFIVFVFVAGGNWFGQRSDITHLTETVAAAKAEAVLQAMAAEKELQDFKRQVAERAAAAEQDRKEQAAVLQTVRDATMTNGERQAFIIKELEGLRK